MIYVNCDTILVDQMFFSVFMFNKKNLVNIFLSKAGDQRLTSCSENTSSNKTHYPSK